MKTLKTILESGWFKKQDLLYKAGIHANKVHAAFGMNPEVSGHKARTMAKRRAYWHDVAHGKQPLPTTYMKGKKS